MQPDGASRLLRTTKKPRHQGRGKERYFLALAFFLAASFLRLMRARRRFLLMTLLVCRPMVGSNKGLRFSDSRMRVKPLKRAHQERTSHEIDGSSHGELPEGLVFDYNNAHVSQILARVAAGSSFGRFLESERRSRSAVSGLGARLARDSARLACSERAGFSGAGALFDAPRMFGKIANASVTATVSEYP